MRTRAWRSKTNVLAVVLPLCGVLGLASPRGAGATVTVSPLTFSATEGSSFSGTVATATDDRPGATAADLTATIDWGDGNMSAGSLFLSSGAFAVNGTHTYAEEGTFTVNVTVTDTVDQSTDTKASTGDVSEGDALSGTPVTFVATAGTSFTGTVATFTDSYTANPASDFTATINWGDATTTVGVVSGGGGSFSVSGTHTYAGGGVFSVMVTLADDAPGTATATVTSTADVGSASGVTAFPRTFAMTEAVSASPTVASFSDSRGGAVPSDFTTSIAWGDGNTTAGTVAASGGGAFNISGTHAYADEGVFSVVVHVTDNVSMAAAMTTSTANVAEGDALAGTPVTFSANTGVPFSGVVATFTDGNTSNVPSDFTATIDWGDATTSAGVIAGGGGSFSVSGSHTYTAPGTYSVKVTLADDAPGTATATVTSTANVVSAVAAVPALDWRGLAALTLALSAAALFLLRKG